MNSLNRTARAAGLLYVLYIIMHILADLVGRAPIIVYGDAQTTAQNIMNSVWQFRFGFIMDLFAAVLFLVAAWSLYKLLKPGGKSTALMFLLLNFGGVIIQCVSDLYLIAAELLISGPDYLSLFTTEQRQALAMFFLYLYKNGFMVAQIFYGAWLFPLGYAAFKSVLIPKLFGIVLMVHSVFWLMTFLQFFLFPGFRALTYVSYPIGFLAEAGLALWLMIFGVKRTQPGLKLNT